MKIIERCRAKLATMPARAKERLIHFSILACYGLIAMELLIRHDWLGASGWLLAGFNWHLVRLFQTLAERWLKSFHLLSFELGRRVVIESTLRHSAQQPERIN